MAKRTVAAITAASILLTAPGLGCWQAAAQVVRVPGGVAAPAPVVVPRTAPALPAAPELSGAPFTGPEWTRIGNHLHALPYVSGLPGLQAAPSGLGPQGATFVLPRGQAAAPGAGHAVSGAASAPSQDEGGRETLERAAQRIDALFAGSARREGAVDAEPVVLPRAGGSTAAAPGPLADDAAFLKRAFRDFHGLIHVHSKRSGLDEAGGLTLDYAAVLRKALAAFAGEYSAEASAPVFRKVLTLFEQPIRVFEAAAKELKTLPELRHEVVAVAIGGIYGLKLAPETLDASVADAVRLADRAVAYFDLVEPAAPPLQFLDSYGREVPQGPKLSPLEGALQAIHALFPKAAEALSTGVTYTAVAGLATPVVAAIALPLSPMTGVMVLATMYALGEVFPAFYRLRSGLSKPAQAFLPAALLTAGAGILGWVSLPLGILGLVNALLAHSYLTRFVSMSYSEREHAGFGPRAAPSFFVLAYEAQIAALALAAAFPAAAAGLFAAGTAVFLSLLGGSKSSTGVAPESGRLSPGRALASAAAFLLPVATTYGVGFAFGLMPGSLVAIGWMLASWAYGAHVHDWGERPDASLRNVIGDAMGKGFLFTAGAYLVHGVIRASTGVAPAKGKRVIPPGHSVDRRPYDVGMVDHLTAELLGSAVLATIVGLVFAPKAALVFGAAAAAVTIVLYAVIAGALHAERFATWLDMRALRREIAETAFAGNVLGVDLEDDMMTIRVIVQDASEKAIAGIPYSYRGRAVDVWTKSEWTDGLKRVYREAPPAPAPVHEVTPLVMAYRSLYARLKWRHRNVADVRFAEPGTLYVFLHRLGGSRRGIPMRWKGYAVEYRQRDWDPRAYAGKGPSTGAVGKDNSALGHVKVGLGVVALAAGAFFAAPHLSVWLGLITLTAAAGAVLGVAVGLEVRFGEPKRDILPADVSFIGLLGALFGGAAGSALAILRAVVTSSTGAMPGRPLPTVLGSALAGVLAAFAGGVALYQAAPLAAVILGSIAGGVMAVRGLGESAAPLVAKVAEKTRSTASESSLYIGGAAVALALAALGAGLPLAVVGAVLGTGGGFLLRSMREFERQVKDRLFFENRDAARVRLAGYHGVIAVDAAVSPEGERYFLVTASAGHAALPKDFRGYPLRVRVELPSVMPVRVTDSPATRLVTLPDSGSTAAAPRQVTEQRTLRLALFERSAFYPWAKETAFELGVDLRIQTISGVIAKTLGLTATGSPKAVKAFWQALADWLEARE